MRDKIPFNVWDDYWDDCTGKKQETYGYIESDEISESDQEQFCAVLAEWINTNIALPENLNVEANGTTVDFENLTHEFREETLMPALQASGLTYEGKEVSFYSES